MLSDSILETEMAACADFGREATGSKQAGLEERLNIRLPTLTAMLTGLGLK